MLVEALEDRLKVKDELPSFSQWTIDEPTAAILIDEVMSHRPRHILECGSGLSTVLMGYCAEEVDGTVVAFEHDRGFYQQTRDQLRKHGVLPAAVWHLPLTSFTVPHADAKRYVHRWYDFQQVPAIKVDFMLVDGPPGHMGRHIRYPAVPLLRKWLEPGCIIFMDDAKRDDEAEIIEMWCKQFGLMKVKEYDTKRGAVTLQVPPGGK